MTTYTRTETVEAMRWNGMPTLHVNYPDWDAETIVAWVIDHGGEARYNPPLPRNGFTSIAVCTNTHYNHALPGDLIVMGEKQHPFDPESVAHTFTVVPAAEWSSQGWQVC